jgi:drug/metabolite transporter (DMT)-like permease
LANPPPIAARTARAQGLQAAIWGWILFVAVETATQVVFKLAGATLDDSAGPLQLVRHALATPVVLLGFGLYFCGFLVWITILKDVDLGRAFPMTATIYLATLAAAVFMFHERLNPTRVAGVVVIIAGVLLLASDEDTHRPGKDAVDG